MKTIEKRTIFFCLFFVIKKLVNRITVQVFSTDIRILDLCIIRPVLHFLMCQHTAETRTLHAVRVSKTVLYTTTCVITTLLQLFDNQWPAFDHTFEEKVSLVRDLALIETYVLTVEIL